MVSNFERILKEIRREARQLAGDCRLEPENMAKLIMEIVDLEDSNRIKAVSGINQKIKGMIADAASADTSREDT